MADDEHEGHHIEVHLDRLLSERGMTVTELAHRVGVTNVNLSVLKNGRAKAVRFTTLTRICEVLRCQPGDLLSYRPEPTSDGTPQAAPGDRT
ncbi:helix-turn-helix transcriptional regulator [Streptomyces canus]|uniref:helix-turn-helix domain-containing protein n=1 Tax=Streptomyces canus TaxID=58343 RepID=UPI002E2B42F1|nr:helix-turn-helix transcriptional regulator [Streptomyces canus]